MILVRSPYKYTIGSISMQYSRYFLNELYISKINEWYANVKYTIKNTSILKHERLINAHKEGSAVYAYMSTDFRPKDNMVYLGDIIEVNGVNMIVLGEDKDFYTLAEASFRLLKQTDYSKRDCNLIWYRNIFAKTKKGESFKIQKTVLWNSL